jgi:hypothetical protein
MKKAKMADWQSLSRPEQTLFAMSSGARGLPRLKRAAAGGSAEQLVVGSFSGRTIA